MMLFLFLRKVKAACKPIIGNHWGFVEFPMHWWQAIVVEYLHFFLYSYLCLYLLVKPSSTCIKVLLNFHCIDGNWQPMVSSWVLVIVFRLSFVFVFACKLFIGTHLGFVEFPMHWWQPSNIVRVFVVACLPNGSS